MTAVNIFMVLCLYPFILIMYVLVKNEAMDKDKLLFGVTLTKEQFADATVQAVEKSYRRQMRMWLVILLLMPIPLLFLPWFSIFLSGWMLWMGISVFVFFLPFWLANKKLRAWKKENGGKNQGEQTVSAEPKEADEYWLGGMIYCNPQDKHFMVEKRTGIGTTVNLGTFSGKVFYFLLAAGMTVLMLGTCIWVICLEFTPIKLEIKEQQIVATHLRTEYEVPLEDIRSSELITELPKMLRNNGNAMDNVRSGQFRILDQGNCEVFFNPQNTLYIRVETADELYFFGGADDEQTRLVYEQLK